MIKWCAEESNGLHNASSSGVDTGIAGLMTIVRGDRESDQTATTVRQADMIARPIARVRHFFRLPGSSVPTGAAGTAGVETTTVASGAATGGVSLLGCQAILNLPLGSSTTKGSCLPSFR